MTQQCKNSYVFYDIAEMTQQCKNSYVFYDIGEMTQQCKNSYVFYDIEEMTQQCKHSYEMAYSIKQYQCNYFLWCREKPELLAQLQSIHEGAGGGIWSLTIS